ncbi:MAG: hypothetical protein AB2L20_15005 [Mangrovibacterium sp.]
MENAKIEIIKASIKNDRCEVTYKEIFKEANYSNEVSKKCEQVVHADMRKAFDRLKLHLISVCEQPEAVEITSENLYELDLEQFPNYVITGYTIGGSDESAGVTIIGQKLLSSGSVLNLISPFVKFEDLENYQLAGELYADIQACDWEVSEYLFSEKWGIKQTEFDFDLPDGVEMSMEPVPQKKKGRKKKSEMVQPE